MARRYTDVVDVRSDETSTIRRLTISLVLYTSNARSRLRRLVTGAHDGRSDDYINIRRTADAEKAPTVDSSESCSMQRTPSDTLNHTFFVLVYMILLNVLTLESVEHVEACTLTRLINTSSNIESGAGR